MQFRRNETWRHTRGSGRPNQWLRNLNAKLASIPMILTAVVIFLGGTVWTVVYSFTNSKLLPRLSFVGLDQYERLWAAPRWLMSVAEPGDLRRCSR